MKRLFSVSLVGLLTVVSVLSVLAVFIPAPKASAADISATWLSNTQIKIGNVTYTSCEETDKCTSPSGAYNAVSDGQTEFYADDWQKVTGVKPGQPTSYCSVASANVGQYIVGANRSKNSGQIRQLVATYQYSAGTRGTQATSCFGKAQSGKVVDGPNDKTLKFTAAAPTLSGKFTSRATIQLSDGTIYTDGNTGDKNENYYTPVEKVSDPLNAQAGCASFVIESFSSNHTSAEVFKLSRGTVGGVNAGCTKTSVSKVNLDPAAYNNTYVWSSSKTITSADGRGTVFAAAQEGSTALTYTDGNCFVTLSVASGDSTQNTTGSFSTKYTGDATGKNVGADRKCLQENDGYPAGKVNIAKYSAAAVIANSTSQQTCTTGTDDNGNCKSDLNGEVLDCGGGAMSWIICPVINLAVGGANMLDRFIMQSLDINIEEIFGDGEIASSYYTAWNSFRILATAVLLIGGLIMVVSQALGFELLDAYTVRKVLPRLLIAVVGISLSWPLMEFVMSFFNTLGVDIRQLIYTPFSQLGGGITVATGLLTTILTGGTLLVLGFTSLTFILTALLSTLVGFIILVIRQIAIIALIIVAPVAIACYILPNTQKVWNLWYQNFLGLMLMFPIISALIAAGHVFSAIAVTKGSIVWQAIALVAYIVPYFLLPMAARLATGVIGTLAGLVNDRGKGVFDRLKGMRSNAAANNLQAMKVGNRFKGDSAAANAFNRTTSGIAAIPHAGVNPARMGSRMQAAMSQQTMAEAAEFAEKSQDFAVISANDGLLRAGIHGKGSDAKVRAWLKDKEGMSGPALEQGVAAIRAARRAAPSEVFETAAVMALPATGTAFKSEFDAETKQWKGGAGEMHKYINDVAGSDRVKAGRMLAAMRSGASSARRFDLSGGGFGAQLTSLEDQYTQSLGAQYNEEVEVSNATKRTIQQSLEGQGGGYVAGSRNSAVAAFAPVMLENLQTVADSGQIVQFKQELAKLAGRYDAMSQVAPENAKILADGVLSRQVNGRTVRDWIEDNRGDSNFLDMRKEYGAAARGGATAAATAAQQAADALRPQGGPQGPVVPPVNPFIP